jgi:hypothetical protein
VIAKISRGWRAQGLVAYLMGPGRFNEHTNQHVVASWDGMAHRHQPAQLAGGGFDVSALADALTDPAVQAGIPLSEPAPSAPGAKPGRGPVWHCSLRNHASDRVLSDAEWARVVEDLMHATGIAPRGDLGACRWVAIRHADDHVHVAAVLVRQDTGKRVHPRNDFHRAGEVCRAAEARLGLTSTAPFDRTQAPQASRAEVEKAARRDVDEPSRVWLRRVCRVAAVQARDPEEFFARLADLGALVRPREMPPGQLGGYAVAAPGDVTAAGAPVWFSGRTLARDLALPKLLQRWSSAPAPAPPVAPAPGERSSIGREEREAATDEATAVATAAAAALAELNSPGGNASGTGGDLALRPAAVIATRIGGGAGGEDPAGLIHAAGDLVTAVAVVTGQGQRRGGVGDAFDRAARQPGVGQPSRYGRLAAQLRSTAWRLIAVRSIGGRLSDDGGVAELLVALASLLAEIAAMHEQRQHHVQAAAARRARSALRSAGGGPGRASGLATPDGRRDGGGPGRRALAGTPGTRGRDGGGAPVSPNGPAVRPSSGTVTPGAVVKPGGDRPGPAGTSGGGTSGAGEDEGRGRGR